MKEEIRKIEIGGWKLIAGNPVDIAENLVQVCFFLLTANALYCPYIH
jgi:hypothetical protein